MRIIESKVQNTNKKRIISKRVKVCTWHKPGMPESHRSNQLYWGCHTNNQSAEFSPVNDRIGAIKLNYRWEATRQLMYAKSTHVSTIFLANRNLL
jgi:hypothetical protein